MFSLKKTYSFISSLLLLIPFSSVFAADNIKELTVFTSILPQQYFVEKISGDKVNVEILVSPGKSPATYEPTPQQIMGLGNADVLFTIGVPFEKAFIPTIEKALPKLKVVDTSKGIQKRMLDGKNVKDPHIWLSPRLVKIQAKTIYQTLVNLDTKNADNYKRGYQDLVKELDDVDAKLKNALVAYKGKTMFVFHPAFGYFADDYGLKQVAIETNGKEPAPAKLEEIIEHAKAEDVHIIFVQPEFSKNAANSIAQAIDGSVVTLSTLPPNYTSNLLYIASELEKTFR